MEEMTYTLLTNGKFKKKILINLNSSETGVCLICGLQGYTGGRDANILILKLLHYGNTSRGRHSVGMGSNKGWFKSEDDPETFCQKKEFIEYGKSKNVIVHNRYATVGGHTVDNAHPFVYEHEDGREVIGIHNGWFKNWKQHYALINEVEGIKLNSTETSAEKAMKSVGLECPEVDSDMFYKHFTERDFNPEELTRFYGSAAFMYLLNGKLHVFRRESKPLYIGKSNSGYYFSSKKEPLNMAGLRDVQMIKENTLFVYEDGKLLQETKVTPNDIKFTEVDMSPSKWMSIVPHDHDIRPVYTPSTSSYSDGRRSQRMSAPKGSKRDSAIALGSGLLIVDVKRAGNTVKGSKVAIGTSADTKGNRYWFEVNDDGVALIPVYMHDDASYKSITIRINDGSQEFVCSNPVKVHNQSIMEVSATVPYYAGPKRRSGICYGHFYHQDSECKYPNSKKEVEDLIASEATSEEFSKLVEGLNVNEGESSDERSYIKGQIEARAEVINRSMDGFGSTYSRATSVFNMINESRDDDWFAMDLFITNTSPTLWALTMFIEEFNDGHSVDSAMDMEDVRKEILSMLMSIKDIDTNKLKKKWTRNPFLRKEIKEDIEETHASLSGALCEMYDISSDIVSEFQSISDAITT